MKVTQFSGIETLVVAAIFGATIDSRKKANYDKYYSQSCAWLLRVPNGLTTPNNTSGLAPTSPYWIELVTKDLRMNYKGSILPRLMSKTPSRLLARRPSVSMASSKPLQGWPSLTVFSLRMLGIFFSRMVGGRLSLVIQWLSLVIQFHEQYIFLQLPMGQGTPHDWSKVMHQWSSMQYFLPSRSPVSFARLLRTSTTGCRWRANAWRRGLQWGIVPIDDAPSLYQYYRVSVYLFVKVVTTLECPAMRCHRLSSFGPAGKDSN